jgi:hypothetical protein
MEVICLEEPAFYELIKEVVSRLQPKPEAQKWVNEEQAMTLLNVKAKSTMQELRNNGKIRFSQPQKKIILYDRDSIMTYLDNHAKDTF